MERLTREMTFEEEYTILQKEVKELFDKEDRENEPPKSHCVVRRALRCIKKLVAELESYKEYKDLEELKVIKEMDLSIPQHFTKEQSDWIKKYCINRNREFYNKAIDDFVNFANTMPTVETEDGTIRPMWLEEMAEKLKGGR